MRSEIIQIVAYNKYEDCSHLNSIISQKIVSLIFFKDYLMTKLTLVGESMVSATDWFSTHNNSQKV